MNKIKFMCGECAGIGYINQKYVEHNDGKYYIEQDACKKCNGKGYIEYVMFTLEEAEVILKHCGLNTKDK